MELISSGLLRDERVGLIDRDEAFVREEMSSIDRWW